MMDYKDFDQFCEDMMIPANEKLETNILDKTLARTMTLYHGTKHKDLKTVNPTSLNMGTRLSNKPRKSSFWTKDLTYAIIWALDWVAIEAQIPYFHDIEGKAFVIPNAVITKKFPNGREEDFDVWDLFFKTLKEHPVYVYKAEIPTKYIGRGQLPIDEYTVDKAITPDSVIEVTPEMVKNKIVQWAELDTFNKYHDIQYGVHRKDKISLKEKLIFKDPYKTLSKRTELMQKETINIQFKAVESFIEWCDEMMITVHTGKH